MREREINLHLQYIDSILCGRDGILPTCPDCGRILDTENDRKVHLEQKLCVKSRCKICGRDLLHHSCPKWHFLEPYWTRAHIRHCFNVVIGKIPIGKTSSKRSRSRERDKKYKKHKDKKHKDRCKDKDEDKDGRPRQIQTSNLVLFQGNTMPHYIVEHYSGPRRWGATACRNSYYSIPHRGFGRTS